MIVIVPNTLRDAINEKLEEAYKTMPEAEIERDIHFNACLSYFDEYGDLPEFEIKRNLAL